VRLAAMRAGALGCSISGAGPTLFAWALAKDAHGVLEAKRREFAAASVSIDEWLVGMSGGWRQHHRVRLSESRHRA